MKLVNVTMLAARLRMVAGVREDEAKAALQFALENRLVPSSNRDGCTQADNALYAAARLRGAAHELRQLANALENQAELDALMGVAPTVAKGAA